jgi:hypothetical protein
MTKEMGLDHCINELKLYTLELPLDILGSDRLHILSPYLSLLCVNFIGINSELQIFV